MINDWKFDLGHLTQALFAQRYFIALGTILLTLIGVALVSMKADIYAADALVLVEDRGLNVTEAESILEQGVVDDESVLGHVELMKGPETLRRALSDLREKGINVFADDEDAGGGLLASVAAAIPNPLWSEKGGLAENGFDETRLSPDMIAFSRKLSVSTLGKARLIKVTFEHNDPTVAAAGANALADSYVTLRRDEQVQVGNDAVAWMMEQASELRAKSTQADQAVETFRRDSGLLQTGGTRLIEQKITEIQTQLTTAELDSLALQTKVEAIDKALQKNNPFAVPEIANAESVAELRLQINGFNAELADLQATYGPNHPLLLAKEEQITLSKKALADEINNIVVGFRNDARGAEQRVIALRQVLQTQEEALADANLRGVALNDLEKDAKIGNEVLEGFLGRLQEVASREDLRVQPLNLRVVSRAETPVEPAGTPKAILGAICLVGGFLVSGSAAMFREMSRRVVRDPDDLKSLAPNGRILVIPRREGHDPNGRPLHHLISATPYAHFSASVRNAYRQSIATLPDDQQTIMMTSAQPGDGKTTMALCFAEVVANTDRSVVLVDTDFRRPKIHIHTGLGRIAGLSDWLEGTQPLRCKRPEGSEFYTITAGSSELLHPDRWNSQTIQELIATLKRRFECVILDTPPVAALADPLLIAAECSMVMFVTRWQHTKLNYVRDFVGPLKERAERVELILTDVDLKGAASHGFKAPMEYYKDTAQYYTE
jgi:uncharacterized protein involved in exopolysaccharide biosynthesis/Mrp family chromosome partitioning ATPase